MKVRFLAMLAGSACFVAAFAGCNGEATPEGKILLQNAAAAYGNGQYEATVRNVDAFMIENSKSSRADEAFYLRGLARYRLKQYDEAAGDLEQAIDRTKIDHIKSNSLNALGDIAYDKDNMVLAGHLYEQALENTERGKKPADHSCYRLGCALQRQGRWAEADPYFQKVIYFFDGSELAKLASRRVNCVAWSIQAGAFEKKANAEKAAAEFTKNSLHAAALSVVESGRLIYVVQVGRYVTYEQAVAALDRVRKMKGDAFVVTTRWKQ